jgi:hypothetical protein
MLFLHGTSLMLFCIILVFCLCCSCPSVPHLFVSVRRNNEQFHYRHIHNYIASLTLIPCRPTALSTKYFVCALWTQHSRSTCDPTSCLMSDSVVDTWH